PARRVAEELGHQIQREQPGAAGQKDQDGQEGPFEDAERCDHVEVSPPAYGVVSLWPTVPIVYMHVTEGPPEVSKPRGGAGIMFWWLMKNVILGPILRLLYRPK